jgi:hypothetical protein
MLVAADARATAFRFGPHHRPHEERPVYRGCVNGRSRAWILGEVAGRGSAEGYRNISQLVIAGTTVAFLYTSAFTPGFGEAKIEWFVVVRDLRSGRTLHRVTTGTKPRFPGSSSPEENPIRFIGGGQTTTIVVTSDGAVAWIVDTEGSPRYQVRAVDKSGDRLLAAGSGIDPHSLALAGSHLYWTEGGVAMSTTLE